MTTQTDGPPVQVPAHQGRHPRRGSRAVRAAGLRPRQHPVHRGPGIGRPGAGDALLHEQGGVVRRRCRRRPDAAGPLGRRRRGPGDRLTRHFLERWEGSLSDDVLIILLRSAVTNEQVAERLRVVFVEQVVAVLARLAPPGEAERRAALVASQLLGLALTRYLLRLPGMADRPLDDVVADIAPNVQRYLTGGLS